MDTQRTGALRVVIKGKDTDEETVHHQFSLNYQTAELVLSQGHIRTTITLNGLTGAVMQPAHQLIQLFKGTIEVFEFELA